MIYFKFASSFFKFIQKRKTLFLGIFAAAFSLWLITLFLMPWILSKGGLLEKHINKQIKGSVAIGFARLSWFKPQRFENITVKDIDGETLLTIRSLQTTASLFSLLTNTNHYQEVVIDGLIGNMVNQKGLQDRVSQTLNSPKLISQEKNKNRITPIFIFKKPCYGHFKVTNSSFLVQSFEHAPIYFNDIQIHCTITDNAEPMVVQIACESAQDNLSGSVNLKLEAGGFDSKGQLIFTPLDREILFLSPEGYLTIATEITNLPSAGIDHLLGALHPKWGQIFSNATGDSITIKGNLHVVKQQSKLNLSASSHDLDIQFAGALRHNQFFLTQPSICRFNVHPAFVQSVAQAVSTDSKLSISHPSNILIQVDRLSTPIDLNNFNFRHLSCNARFSLSPLAFVNDPRLNGIEMKQVQGTIDTFDLNENLSVNLGINAQYLQKPFHASLTGELKKLIDDQQEFIGFNEIHSHFMAKTKDLPTQLALLFLKNTSIASEILGPSLNVDAQFRGSLEAADISLELSSSRLFVNNINLKLQKDFFLTLAKPATFQLRATPKLAQRLIFDKLAILNPFLVDGDLNALNCRIKNKQLLINDLNLELAAAPFDCIISDYKPYHINSTQALFQTKTNDNIELKVSTNIDLPSDFKTYNLAKNVSAEFHLDNFLGYVKGQPALVQADIDSHNWQSRFNGYLDRYFNYELLQEAQINFKDLKLQLGKAQCSAPILLAYLNPSKFNLAKFNFKDTELSGHFFASQLKFIDGSKDYLFEEVKIPFSYDGPQNSFKIDASSKTMIDSFSLKTTSILKNNLFDPNSLNFDCECKLSLFPTELLTSLTSQKINYTSILGPTINTTLKAKIQSLGPLKGTCDYKISSSALESSGSISLNKNYISSSDQLNINYQLSPESYVALTQALKYPIYKELQLIDPANIQAKIAHIEINFDPNKEISSLAFDGNLIVDHLVTNAGALHQFKAILNSSDLNENLKVNVSATTETDQQQGQVFILAELTDPVNLEKKHVNAKINGQIECRLTHFPTAILSDFFPMQSDYPITFYELLGPSFNLSAQANLQSGFGPVSGEIKSQFLFTRFNLKFDHNHLTLNDNLTLEAKLSETQAQHWLYKINPLLTRAKLSTKQTLKMTIPKDKFYFPTSPFQLKGLKIQNAILDIGQVTFIQSKNLATLLKVLNDHPQDQVEGWFSPICFSLSDGVVSTRRTDCLINKKHHIALWGQYDTNQAKLAFYLGIPQKTLAGNLGLNHLPQDYFLQIPVVGQGRHISADWATVITQLCLLKSSQSQSMSPLVELFTKSQPCQSVPENLFTLPWENEPARPTSSKSSKTLTNLEQSNALHQLLNHFQKSLNN